MKKKLVIVVAMIVSVVAHGTFELPEQGAVIGSYVDSTPMADQVKTEEILNFERLIGKKLVWTYFSNNWMNGTIEFPEKNVKACDDANTIPYIRLNPWSEAVTYQADPLFKLQNILDGQYDVELRAWAKRAKEFGKTIIIEFGPEVNGNWFPWNGQWNGGGTTALYGDKDHPDGPERYRDTFRKIIDLFRAEAANNVIWVFHVDTAWAPWRWWNEPKYYYPGHDYIDWLALSVFGRQLPDNEWLNFTEKLKFFWPQIEEVSLTKPVIIAEFAVIEDTEDEGRKARWLSEALESLRTDPELSRIKGISYWNSPGHLSDGTANMKITSSPQAQKAFVDEINKPHWLGRDQLQDGDNNE